jgi:hypothetical protein
MTKLPTRIEIKMNRIENLNITKYNLKTYSTVHSNGQSITILQCEMCLEYTRTEHSDYPFLDNGSEITINGGYGEFFDNINQPDGIKLTICHDCTLKLFRMIPKISADKINRLHSVSYFETNHPLCCEYSWTIDEEGLLDQQGNHPVINATIEHAVPQTTYPAPQVSKIDDPEWIAEKMFGEDH